jgi:glucokinase
MIRNTNVIDEFPFPVLIADIGGTNARFALIEDVDSPIERMPDVPTSAYPSLEAAIEAAVYARTELRPRSALLAIAAPVNVARIHLTNADWTIEPEKIVAESQLEEMILLNDFEALALSLPDLKADDIDPLDEAVPWESGARVVIGPGTGLGAGALVRGRESWVPVPGEGGHIDLGPVSDRDFAIWPNLERAHGRISGEALLSGSGLVRLYRGICATDAVAPDLAQPSDVTEAGLSGTNPQAVEALTLFGTYLGRTAGNLALVFMARGGVYLAGGISGRIRSTLKSGAFRRAFLDKAPHHALLDTIPTSIITRDDPALAGIAAYARTPRRFVVDVAGRRWRKQAK